MELDLILESVGPLDPIFMVKSFVALFVIVDAFGVVPIFISLLEGYREADKQAMIKMAVRVATIALIILTLAGKPIFQLLGIGMYSFRIAGGIILLIISIEMLFGRKTRTGSSEEFKIEKEDIAITPMAVPLLTGPGAITTGIVLFDEAGTVLNKLVLMVNILLVFWISYIIFSRLNLVYNVLGRTGTKVVTRIMGLMLSAISVQFIISGISEVVSSGIIG
jgi:multiple antibiotic resistance protein